MALDIRPGVKPIKKRDIGFISSSSGSVDHGGSQESVLVPTVSSSSDGARPRVKDTVANPTHYSRLKPQPIQVSVDWGLNYLRATALKYLARAGNKEGVDEVEDLRKAISYLEREIKRIKGEPVA